MNGDSDMDGGMDRNIGRGKGMDGDRIRDRSKNRYL